MGGVGVTLVGVGISGVFVDVFTNVSVGGVTGVSLGGLGVSGILVGVVVGGRLVAVLVGVWVGVGDSVTQGVKVSSLSSGYTSGHTGEVVAVGCSPRRNVKFPILAVIVQPNPAIERGKIILAALDITLSLFIQ